MITKDFVFSGDAVFSFENTTDYGVNAGGKYTYRVNKVGIEGGLCVVCDGGGVDKRGYQNKRCKSCNGTGESRPIYFASVMAYPEESDPNFVYLGVVNCDSGSVYHTRGSKVGERDIRLMVLRDVMKIVFGKKKLSQGYELRKEEP